MKDGNETYKQVRALKRGLDVLVMLNTLGSAGIATLSDKTDIHRTTMYRVLETLQNLGYVRHNPADDRFHLTAQVRNLSEGYDEQSERIVSAASGYLDTLLHEVEWPSSLATPQQDAMVIRDTTHGRSELYVHDVSVGTRSPILTTAMGRAYLAHCSDDEREGLLEKVAASSSPEAALARDADYIQRVIETTRESGYGLSFGDTHARLGSVAMPIRVDERVMGCVNVVFLTGLVARQQAVRKFVPALERAVTAIERNLAH